MNNTPTESTTVRHSSGLDSIHASQTIDRDEHRSKSSSSTIGTVVETLPDRFELRTDNPWEEICGHTRAVRRGPFVSIAGTTASDPTKGVLHVSCSISLVHTRY